MQFSNYLIHEDVKFINSTQEGDQFECQRDLIREIIAFGVDRNGARSSQDNYSSFLGEKLVGKVERYDPEKDFGFMSLAELNDDVYFKVAKLDRNDLNTIHDGDIVYCTLGQGEKGIQISTIDGFVESRNKLEIEDCSIKFFNPDRGFGFAIVGSSSNEAFFHKTAFPHSLYEYLKEGLAFSAEIRMKEDGKYQVRRCIDLL